MAEPATDLTFDSAALLASEEHEVTIVGRSPWYLAWRRLRRNYLALASLGLFFVIVIACALAPVYAHHVAHTGPNDVHEFVVIQTDLAPDALPTDANGVVDESGGGMTVIDEIEDLAVGATEDLTVTLAAGNYALICNIFDEDENEAHYQMGMYSAFTVE